MTTTSPGEFLAAAPGKARAGDGVNGSSPWATAYASEIRRVVLEHAARAPRTLQQHLGPSEIGVPCDRQVAGKLAALPATNHVADPWPSIMGTAGHAWVEGAFNADNLRRHMLRWVTETRVTPHHDHPGTSDLYDAFEQAVVDHKFLGRTSLKKIRKIVFQPGDVPWAARAALWPRKYLVQLLLYGYGFWLLGLPVGRVVLVAYPRTESTLDNLYVTDIGFASDGPDGGGRLILPEVIALLNEVYDDTARRRQQAKSLVRGELGLMDIPMAADDEECYFCPFYRPQAAYDRGTGCPGPRKGGA